MLAPQPSIKKAYNEFNENPTNGSDTDTWSDRQMDEKCRCGLHTRSSFLLHKECPKSNNLTATYIS